MSIIVRHRIGKGTEVMSVQEFADFIEVTRGRIYQYERDGMPTIRNKNMIWVPVKKALQWLKPKGLRRSKALPVIKQ